LQFAFSTQNNIKSLLQKQPFITAHFRSSLVGPIPRRRPFQSRSLLFEKGALRIHRLPIYSHAL